LVVRWCNWLPWQKAYRVEGKPNALNKRGSRKTVMVAIPLAPDSPEGYPQTAPYEWWDWHDTYGEHEPSRWFGEPDPNDPNDIRPPRSS